MAGKKKNSQGKDPKTFQGNSQGWDPVSQKETAREGPENLLENQVKGGEFKKSERKRSGRKRRKKEKEGEVQKKELVENVQRKDRKPLYGEDERGKERQGRQKERQTSESETSLGEIWKMALRKIAEKEGDDGKVAAAASSSEMEQMGRGDSTKG